jgi:hypothetical protein
VPRKETNLNILAADNTEEEKARKETDKPAEEKDTHIEEGMLNAKTDPKPDTQKESTGSPDLQDNDQPVDEQVEDDIEGEGKDSPKKKTPDKEKQMGDREETLEKEQKNVEHESQIQVELADEAELSSLTGDALAKRLAEVQKIINDNREHPMETDEIRSDISKSKMEQRMAFGRKQNMPDTVAEDSEMKKKRLLIAQKVSQATLESAIEFPDLFPIGNAVHPPKPKMSDEEVKRKKKIVDTYTILASKLHNKIQE